MTVRPLGALAVTAALALAACGEKSDEGARATGTDCDITVVGTILYGPDAKGHPTPEDAVRRQFADAFEPGDVLERFESPPDRVALGIVRDGEPIRGFEVMRAGDGGWLVTSDSRVGC
jgi:hypothetical protein